MNCFHCNTNRVESPVIICKTCEALPDHAFFSPSAAFLYGSTRYKMIDGSIVEITFKTKDKEGSKYGWRDKVYLGEIMQYEGMGRLGELTRWEDSIDRLQDDFDFFNYIDR